MKKEETKKYLMNMREAINALEKEFCKDISKDGTLTVNVEDGTRVNRVLVCSDNHFGGLYYPEQEPCDDAISRQAAIDACLIGWNKDYKEIVKEIRVLPPVNPVEKQKPCDDCISRSSIKQKLQERHDFYVNTYGGFSDMPQSYKSRVDEISDCIGMVLNEPLVTPTEKVKKWIKTNEGFSLYKCTACGSIEFKESNYCPSCGSRMMQEGKE